MLSVSLFGDIAKASDLIQLLHWITCTYMDIT